MPTIRGCHLPDELLYDVENNIWYRENADGAVTVGMTAVAAAMAGELVAFTAKKAGRAVQAGKSCATIESGKWVGPAKIAFDAEVVEVNDALTGTPKLTTLTAEGGWLRFGQRTGRQPKRYSFPARP
jgi:glycine cleavage system H protein